MPVTVNVNGLSVAHQTSNGVAMATVPDVCKTPSPAGPVPIPYPNIAMTSDLVAGTATVTVDGSSAAIVGAKLIKSSGDEAGVAGGVVSQVFIMEASFISFSPTVMFDGKPVCRLTDKMLMNKMNTVCMAGLVNPVVPPAAPASPAMESRFEPISSEPPPEEPKDCVLRGVIVSCGHGKRGLQMDLARKDAHVLQVISKVTEPDTLIIDWDGDCRDSHDYCPAVRVRGPDGTAMQKRSSPALELKPPAFYSVRDWIGMFRTLVSPHGEGGSNAYNIEGLVCHGGKTANGGTGQWLRVEVYPEMSLAGSFEIGYSHEEKKGDPTGYDQQSTWKIGGSIKAKLGRDNLSYELSSETHADKFPLMGSLLGLVGKTGKVFDSMARYGGDVKVKPRWPKWEFAADLKAIELTGKPLVGTEGSFKFGFDPLFGVEMEVSILDWLIRFAGSLAGPPGALLGQALVQVRKRFAKGAGSDESFAQASLDIDVKLTAGGDIKAGFGLKFVQGKGELDGDATRIEGGVDVKVEGHVIGKARVWRFDASGAGKVGAGAAESTATEPSRMGVRGQAQGGAKDPLKPTWQVFFTGLGVYYLLYLEVGVGGAENKKAEQGGDDDDPKVTSKPAAKRKLFEKSGTCVLLKPWTWPKSA